MLLYCPGSVSWEGRQDRNLSLGHRRLVNARVSPSLGRPSTVRPSASCRLAPGRGQRFGPNSDESFPVSVHSGDRLRWGLRNRLRSWHSLRSPASRPPGWLRS